MMIMVIDLNENESFSCRRMYVRCLVYFVAVKVFLFSRIYTENVRNGKTVDDDK